MYLNSLHFIYTCILRNCSTDIYLLCTGNRGGLSSKIAKTEDDRFDFDDELDDLGVAALEQYELTQRDPAQNRSPTPGSDPVLISLSGASAFTPLSTVLEQQSTMAGASQKGNWRNPYKEALSSVHQPTVVGKSSASSEASEDYREQIRKLQEQSYSRDGEVKVLRGEKERLMGELRKTYEQMQDIQSKLTSEKQKVQEQLTTKLQFRDQELQAKEQQLLVKERELAKLREQLGLQKALPAAVSTAPFSSSSTVAPRASSSTGSTHRSRLTSGAEFLSTETFMPLSQMTSDVTPVQVHVLE